MSSIFLLFTVVLTVLFLSLEKTSERCFATSKNDSLFLTPHPSQRFPSCLIGLVQKEMHSWNFLLGPLCYITKRCPSSWSSKDNDVPFFLFYHLSDDRESTVPLGCSRSRKKTLSCSVTLKGFQTTNPYFFIAICWHTSLTFPLHTLHLLSYRVAVA